MERIFAAVVVTALFVTSCGGSKREPTDAVRAYCGDEADEVEQRIDALIPRLTLAEKVNMLAGSLTGERLWTVPGHAESGIPDFVMIDGPRGLSQLAGPATSFPVGMARGATFDPELEARLGAAIGREVRASGRNVLLGPTMNILTHPRWGRAQETYGEDPMHMGAMAVGFVLGAQTEVPVTAKHFAVNNIDATRLTLNVTVDARTLREIYLPHFARVVRDGHVAGVMSAYNSVNGFYCSENAHLLRDILKDEWGFSGFVVSDWGGTQANTPGTHDHTIATATAGLDVEMFVPNAYGVPLADAVAAGEVPEALVDDMVRRQLRAKFCHHLDTDPPVVDETVPGSPAHRALAREVAERSIVLLQNRDDALPIARGAATNIVVTGPLATVPNLGDATGSSAVDAENVVTGLAGLMANAGGSTITHIAVPPDAPVDQAAISAADVVIIFAGLVSSDEGEELIGAGDRASLALPDGQAAWITDVAALSSRVVLVLEGGSALTLGTIPSEVEAIVMAWYPGVEGGSAIANVLYGDVNPSGRLPLVFPVAEVDLPFFDNVSDEVTYSYFHGYRHLDHEGTVPLFPFGFGLSYTRYGYANLVAPAAPLASTDTLHVTLDVTNTGSRAGIETVQLYVGAASTTITPRFERELRGFTQVALEAGETKAVTFDVPVRELAYWDTASNAFVVEPTTYRVEVGASSRDLPLTAMITVAP